MTLIFYWQSPSVGTAHVWVLKIQVSDFRQARLFQQRAASYKEGELQHSKEQIWIVNAGGFPWGRLYRETCSQNNISWHNVAGVINFVEKKMRKPWTWIPWVLCLCFPPKKMTGFNSHGETAAVRVWHIIMAATAAETCKPVSRQQLNCVFWRKELHTCGGFWAGGR